MATQQVGYFDEDEQDILAGRSSYSPVNEPYVDNAVNRSRRVLMPGNVVEEFQRICNAKKRLQSKEQPPKKKRKEDEVLQTKSSYKKSNKSGKNKPDKEPKDSGKRNKSRR